MNAVYKMPREMADVLDRIKEYGQRQGINSRDELISGILSAFLTGAAELENGSVEYNGNDYLDKS